MALTFSITDNLSVFDVSIISIFTFTVKGLKGIKYRVCNKTHTPKKVGIKKGSLADCLL